MAAAGFSRGNTTDNVNALLPGNEAGKVVERTTEQQPTKEKKNQLADEAVDAASEEDDLFTEKITLLPFVHEQDKLYYPRACYDEYYTLVKKMLDDGKECVTVTGTPGIGKSIFYGHFFKRYQEEVDSTWIIANSYKGNTVERIVIYKGGNIEKHPLHHEMDWLNTVKNDDCTLYMPLWELNDLLEAAWYLGLTDTSEGKNCISDDDISIQFNTFGGVARECFLRTQSLVDIHEDSLIQEVHKLSDSVEMANLLKGEETKIVCPRVIHYVPNANRGMISATTKVASPFVEREIAEHMYKLGYL